MKYLIPLLLLLVGCGHTPPEPEIIYQVVQVNCKYDKIDPIITFPVEWIVATDDNGFKVLGLRGDSYTNLTLNSDRTLSYIIEQNKAIGYYEKCIKDHNLRAQKEGEQ